MENEFKKSNTNFGQRSTFGVLLAVSIFVLVFVAGLAITQTANAALSCTGEYTSCNIDYGGVKKGICLAGLCGSTDISLNLKSKYNAAKTYCADSATKNECITPTVKPEVNGNGDLIGFSCNAKEVNTSCTVSTCAQNPLGTPYSGCTNAAEKCQFYAGSVYYPTYPSCVANTACPDADRDGIPLCWAPGQYTKWDTPVPPPKKDPSRFSDDSGIGDCDDKDPYSYGYSSANIASVSVADVNGIKRNIPVGNFSPVDTIKVTVNFKKKCGHTIPTPPAVPLHVSLVFSSTEEFTLSGSSPTSFARKTDFVYTADIPLQSRLTEELIAAIAKNPKPKLKFLGADEFTRSDKPFNDPILPMTNCAQTYGTGRHKVVYMRDNTSVYGQILNWSKYGVTGFTTIEPLKKYQNEFSHFVDLKKSPLLFTKIRGSSLFLLRYLSSCGPWNSMYFGVYLDPTQQYAMGNGFANPSAHMGAAMIQQGGWEGDMPFTMVHEFGHAFGNLSDEYIDILRDFAFGNDVEKIRRYLIPHCSFEPAKDYTVGGKLYGATKYNGCTIIGTNGGKRPEIFRPSGDSIMRTVVDPTAGPIRTGNLSRFNAISCAYIIKNIKDSPTFKQHLDECAAMPGIVPVGQ